MNYNKIKIYGYVFFGVCITLLVFMALLGIWDVISEDVAFKSVTSLAVMWFAFLFFIAIWQKLFWEK